MHRHHAKHRIAALVASAGLAVLLAADLVLAASTALGFIIGGILLWGLHMAMTQGLLSTIVAEVAPPQLRGTAFGLFNLVSGVAMLLASVMAGVLWDRFGAEGTFLAGACFCVVTLAGILLKPKR